MDSGIDSTESSNESICDAAIINENQSNDYSIKSILNIPFQLDQWNQSNEQTSPNQDQSIPTKQSIESGLSSSLNVNEDQLNIDHITEASKVDKIDFQKSSDKNEGNWNAEKVNDAEMLSESEKHLKEGNPPNYLKIPKINITFYDPEGHREVISIQKPQLTLPEGCRLKIHFPKYELQPDYPSNEEEISPIALSSIPLSVANGPFEVCKSLQPYEASLAVLPYESRDLRRKFKHYRARLRRLVSTKPKERKLRTAAALNNIDLVENLLNEGVEPKSTDGKYRTALHIAASKGYANIVRLLLQHGADPNQKDSVGNTALHLAACTSHVEIVTLLLKAGTDLKLADNQGFSPYHLANSRLKLLQRNSKLPSSSELKTQVLAIVDMMQEYMKQSGHTEDSELLAALTNQLTLSDSANSTDNCMKNLLDSLQDLTLNKSKIS